MQGAQRERGWSELENFQARLSNVIRDDTTKASSQHVNEVGEPFETRVGSEEEMAGSCLATNTKSIGPNVFDRLQPCRRTWPACIPACFSVNGSSFLYLTYRYLGAGLVLHTSHEALADEVRIRGGKRANLAWCPKYNTSSNALQLLTRARS